MTLPTRDVTSDASNDDKLPVGHDKVMGIDVETSPDTLKEFYVNSLAIPRYKITPSASGGDLTVAITHLDGTTPSATKPLYFKIGGTIRAATAALSITIAAATNWFNAGGTGLATKAVPYFVYVVWDSNSSVIVPTISRKPYFALVSETSGTTTSENHVYGHSGFTSTDDLENIGYFEATLSAGAGYTWTVPTFTSANLKHAPTMHSNEMSWTPVHSRTGTAYTNAPTVNNAVYQVISRKCRILEKHTQNATPGGTNYQRMTLPFLNVFSISTQGPASNNTAGTQFVFFFGVSQNYGDFYKYDGTAEATASNVYLVDGEYWIG